MQIMQIMKMMLSLLIFILVLFSVTSCFVLNEGPFSIESDKQQMQQLLRGQRDHTGLVPLTKDNNAHLILYWFDFDNSYQDQLSWLEILLSDEMQQSYQIHSIVGRSIDEKIYTFLAEAGDVFAVDDWDDMEIVGDEIIDSMTTTAQLLSGNSSSNSNDSSNNNSNSNSNNNDNNISADDGQIIDGPKIFFVMLASGWKKFSQNKDDIQSSGIYIDIHDNTDDNTDDNIEEGIGSPAYQVTWERLAREFFEPLLESANEMITVLAAPFSSDMQLFIEETLSSSNHLILSLSLNNLNSEWMNKLESEEQLLDGYGSDRLLEGMLKALQGYALSDQEGKYVLPSGMIFEFDHTMLVTIDELVSYLDKYVPTYGCREYYRLQQLVCRSNVELEAEFESQDGSENLLKSLPIVEFTDLLHFKSGWHFFVPWHLKVSRTAHSNHSLAQGIKKNELPLTIAGEQIVSFNDGLLLRDGSHLYMDELEGDLWQCETYFEDDIVLFLDLLDQKMKDKKPEIKYCNYFQNIE